jgi:hypothetical protein
VNYIVIVAAVDDFLSRNPPLDSQTNRNEVLPMTLINSGSQPLVTIGSTTYSLANCPSVSLSLLGVNGQVQAKHGINWWRGTRQGKPRHPDEACVAIRAAQRAQVAQVFGSSAINTRAVAVMHDGTRLILRLEGNNGAGQTQAKQLSTDGNKRDFGQWILRNVLGLTTGTPVTRAILQRYGRIDIRFYRLGTDPATGLPLIYGDFS